MNGLLLEFSKKLVDRWLTALILPGLLITVVAVCGHILGHRDALSFHRLSAGVQALVGGLNTQPVASLLAVALALLAATGAGLAAHALGVAVHKILVSSRPHWWIRRRRMSALRDSSSGNSHPERYLPARATPVGDRFRLIGQRISAQYGLEVVLAWPRIWLLLPESARNEITSGYAAYRAATRLAGWGLLYVALGTMWWPACMVGVLSLVLGYRRATIAATQASQMTESAVDLYVNALATAIGIALPHERVTPMEGAQINNVLNKRA